LKNAAGGRSLREAGTQSWRAQQITRTLLHGEKIKTT
jgi:hypothetical protein